MQRLQCNFFEEHDVVVAVILQAHVTFVGASATLRLKVKFLFWNRLAFDVVGDLRIVEDNDGVWAIQRNDHGVPLGARLAGTGERLSEGIQRAGNVIFVFLGIFRLIVDLHFVAVVHRHPRLARLDGNANIDAGIVVVIAHLEYNANSAVTKFAGRPIEKSYAAVRLNQAVLDGHIAWPDVLPSGKIFAVEKLLPRLFGLRITGNGQYRRCRENQKKQMTHRPPFAAAHTTRFERAGAKIPASEATNLF